MEYVTFAGSDFEIGEQQGRRYGDVILDEIRQYELETRLPGWRADLDAVRGCLSENFPYMIEEMRGIAGACDLSLDLILCLSAFNALSPLAPFTRGCTNVAAVGIAGNPVLFKTDDGAVRGEKATDQAARDAVATRLRRVNLMRLAPNGGNAFAAVRQFGTLWAEFGVNEHGLVLGTSSGHPVIGPQSAAAIPQHLIPNLVLRNCRDVPDARAFCRAHPVCGKGINFVLMDVHGAAVGVEKCGPYTGFVEADRNVAYVVNHYRAPEMDRIGRDQDPAFYESEYHRNSAQRMAFIESAKPDLEGPAGFESVRAAIAGPDSRLIQSGSDESRGWVTHFAAFVLPAERRILLTEGPPWEGDFGEVELDWDVAKS